MHYTINAQIFPIREITVHFIMFHVLKFEKCTLHIAHCTMFSDSTNSMNIYQNENFGDLRNLSI